MGCVVSVDELLREMSPAVTDRPVLSRRGSRAVTPGPLCYVRTGVSVRPGAGGGSDSLSGRGWEGRNRWECLATGEGRERLTVRVGMITSDREGWQGWD